jgi:hypothetical protein
LRRHVFTEGYKADLEILFREFNTYEILVGKTEGTRLLEET